MNKEIMELLFPDMVQAAKEGKCPFCGKEIDFGEFADELSRKEFGISGLCFACQEKTFK